MKTDIEIAQEAVMEPIKNVAARCGISEDDLELYGKYKAKISDEYINSVKDNEDGKLILVTAINPTPAGEGKTTITVGLGEAFGKLGKKAVIAITWSMFWYQRWSSRWWICTGCSYGRIESAFYRRFPCNHIS